MKLAIALCTSVLAITLLCVASTAGGRPGYGPHSAGRPAANSAARAAVTAGMAYGSPDLKSAGSLAFGPEGILFVGDSQAAAVFAIDVGDQAMDTSAEPVSR